MLKQLSALAFDLHTDRPRLDLGPQGTRILKELVAASNAGLWLSVVILAATLVDVCKHEAGQFYRLSGTDNDLGDLADEVFGLAYLTAKERRQLDILRSRRNALVHYEGPVAGVSGSSDDQTLLASAAEQALTALLPVLENLERWERRG